MRKLGELIYRFINNGGWISIMVMGGIGIIMSVTAMYGKLGFNLTRFLLADLPLFGFCGWALYKPISLIIKYRKDHEN